MSINHRRRAILENSQVELLVLPGGGHIASLRIKPNGVNPLWDPIWETIEPSQFDAKKHTTYGGPGEGLLLCGIAGQNLCLDFFGPPSAEETAAGLSVHGEGSTVDWEVSEQPGRLTLSARLPHAQIAVERQITLGEGSFGPVVEETVENLRADDRPIGWTQHATLGPPFLANGKTEFHVSATRSKVPEGEFAPGHDRFTPGAEFNWPHAPLIAGGTEDLRIYTDQAAGGAFTAHLLDPSREQAFFTAFSPEHKTLFGYVWKRSDFPWIGIWEENRGRAQSPWSAKSLTRGMEFGVSPFPETRRQMIERGTLFGAPGYRWLPAKGKLKVKYCLFIQKAQKASESATWQGNKIDLAGNESIAVG